MPDNTVYHIYGRKHGDLERDYNNFHLDPEPYSQGNGNYRDINQNRRNDVFFEPRVADFNIRTFMNLIQADGHNPLVLLGSRFTISKEAVEAIIGELAVPDRLEAIITRPFRMGELIQTIDELQAEGKLEHGFSINYVFKHATQYIDAEFHEGYWIDHWTYNLDLIEDYLSIYPDNEEELLFGEPSYTYYDSAYIIKPRSQKYVKVDDRVRQYAAVVEDKEKNSLFAARIEPANVMRGENGKGDIFKSTLFEKLTLLAILKFATMDPDGMGIEMESGRPGWYDALNGLPGLFGSSLSETFELERLLRFMLTKLEKYQNPITLAGEAADLFRQLTGLIDNYFMSNDPERDFYHWDKSASNRERYRERIRLGFSGRLDAITHTELVHGLGRIQEKISDGLGRVLSTYRDIVPTYFYYEVLDYTYEFDESGQLSVDEQNRPFIRAKRFKRHTLPIFLEGPTKLLKITEDTAAAEKIHAQVIASPLYDRPLGMFRICTSLSGESHEIGRARAFTPGWLENESIWTHMSFKYLLSLLETGLYEEFFTHFQKALPPNMDPEIYGRSVLENCSFIVSTAHPDDSIHGTGFVARLSGVAAEFLSIWRIMMAGKNPFSYAEDLLQLALKPILPDWIFNDSGEVSFTFLGHTKITYHNPECRPTFKDDIKISSIKLELDDDQKVVIDHEVIGEPYSEMVREGKIKSIDIYFSEISP